MQKKINILASVALIYYGVLSPCVSANVLFYDNELKQYPSGLAIGGSLGNGYLSTHESNNINDNLPANINAAMPSIYKNFNNGHFIWDAYGAYDVLFTERLMMGVAIGYKSLGQSVGAASSNSPANTLNPSGSTTSYTYLDKQQAIDFLITSRLYISEKCKGLNLFAKAGAAYVKASDSVLFNGSVLTLATVVKKTATSSLSIWRIEPEFDLGVGYSLTRHIDVHIMYTYIGGTDGNTSTSASSTTGDNIPWQGVFAYNAVSAGASYSFG